ASPAPQGEVVVSAAASLTDAFADIEAAFELAHPGVDVVLNLGSSSSLREQILEGAPVDVFASADTSNMDQLVEAGEVGGEPDVRALLTKVEAGELDAAITYVTDIASVGGAVEGIPIPEEHNVAVDYPIAVLAGAPEPEAARAFVSFVLSGEGKEILADHGF